MRWSSIFGTIFRNWVRAFALLAILPVAGLAQAISNGTTYFDYGIYCAVETDSQQEAKDTISGVINILSETPVFIRKGTIVPAQIGVGFGIHVDIPDDLSGPVTMATVHPPMGPDGITRETWQTTFTPGQINYSGFTFEFDYELLPGPWQISASIDDRLIYSVDFTVVNPRLTAPIACDGTLLS